MTRLFTIGIACTLLFTACKRDTTLGIGDVNDADKTFAATAGELYLVHRNFSEIAYDNGADSTVIKLAEKIFLTSNSGYNDLLDLCQRLDVHVPGNMTDEHNTLKTQLAGLSGHALDSTYLHLIVEEQHHLLAAYDIMAQTGNNLTLKQHSARYADTMLEYHEQADSLADLF